jgi:light-regulated signal transduction histidine kinase (bacteriophytochrome)
MRDLLADLLTYTQVGSGADEIADAVDMNGIFEGVRRNLQSVIAETDAIITADPLPVLPIHAGHCASLLQNLIGNAIKYRSAQAPRVHVSLAESDGEFRFAVADNGIGIDPKYHEHIFEVFKRLHGSKIPGTGVGLAICKRVVEQYGGRIWVESAEGRGAIFFFTLPTTAARAAGGGE